MATPSATRRLTVAHQGGIHARPALAIVKTVQRFHSRVRLRAGNQEADAGEILQLMSMGIPDGTEVALSAQGPDAEEVLDALTKLFADEFGL